ncbi:uncharacterized protein LOC130995509 [Salvia miltiorrhiza]|uniref:uncharacterized protein LOC130995509 n=1 Tax=Salvia miltiorrhiza TaxID=226208 RepID=UPI0025AD0DEC|nr:uncharacterized protein LOC130995509 [Salvia miltiorrhiza]
MVTKESDSISILKIYIYPTPNHMQLHQTMESFEMKGKRHHKHKRHLHRQPDAYELYELEHMPHELTKAPSDRDRDRHIFVSADYYETGIEEKPNYYVSGRNVQHSAYKGDCEGDVDCMAHKFIESEHDKFQQTKWMSINK